MFAGKMPGERRSKKRGASVEFAEHRQYAQGDDLRFIDWNIYARLDRLFVKLFMEEEDLALHVVLDASPSMDTPAAADEPVRANADADANTSAGKLGLNKKLFACRLGAALGVIGLAGQNRVGVTVFGTPGRERPASMPDARGKANTPRLSSFILEHAWPDDASTAYGSGDGARSIPLSNSLNEALRTVARARAGKGVIVVVSDFLAAADEGYEAGLKALAQVASSGNYDVYLVQTLAPAEMDPELLGSSALDALVGDLRLTDAETGKAADVTVTSALVQSYRKRLKAYCDELHEYCAARGLAHVLVKTDADLAGLVVNTLRATGVVG